MNKNLMKHATLQQLLDAYEETALKQGVSSKEGDYKKANRAYHKLSELIDELQKRESAFHESLVQLLSNPHIEVRLWAATHMLEVDPVIAVRVLTEIANGPKSLDEFSAKMVLREWQNGRLKLP